MYDIIYISNRDDTGYEKLKERFPLAKRAISLEDAKQRAFTKLFWIVYSDLIINDDFKFDYKVEKWDEDYIHVFKNGDYYDGICLLSKTSIVSEREFNSRFFIDKKEVDIIASIPKPYEIYYIDTYAEYIEALENSKTELFWMTSHNLNPLLDFSLYFSHHNIYDRSQNHAFIHRVDNNDYYNGIFLCSKHAPLSKREIEYRFPVNRKEWDIIGSTSCIYNKFYIDTYEEYENAMITSKTELFWVIPSYVTVLDSFKFDMYFPHNNEYDRKLTHVFLNGIYYDGIMLSSKHNPMSKREFNYRFSLHKKEWPIIASISVFDIVFISYNESFANQNYTQLVTLFPDRKIHRISGIKGIHNAHIEAATVALTDMFWVVDADAIIESTFKFNYQVIKHEHDVVHVWKSKNPINDLVYGYGGIKLLPRNLTLNVDITSSDMTTSISHKFKSMNEISNITAFNTDAFSTWKSAFRECVKLSSKVIVGQDNQETDERLNVWCSIGADKPYGEYAIAGAIAGRTYGQKNAGNIPALSKINDFDWLQEQFNIIYRTS
jgi:hypothetical protein